MELVTNDLILRTQEGKVGECVFDIFERNSSNLIGSCGYHTWFPQHCRAEIGYIIVPNFRKKRLMSQALPEVIKFGFTEMELNRIEAQVNPQNIPSIQLLRKMGFSLEGLLRKNVKIAGVFQDSLLYSLLRKDWKSSEKSGIPTNSSKLYGVDW